MWQTCTEVIPELVRFADLLLLFTFVSSILIMIYLIFNSRNFVNSTLDLGNSIIFLRLNIDSGLQ